MIIHKLATHQAQIDSIIRALKQKINALLALRQNNHYRKVVIAVAGGTSPIKLFEALSNCSDIPWQNIAITLTDERLVAPDSEFSNNKLVTTHLLKNYAAKATWLPIIDVDSSTHGLLIADILKKNNERLYEGAPLHIDIAILGMGEDGHTASLFFHDTNIKVSNDACSSRVFDATGLCKYVNTNPSNAPYSRISLSLSALIAIPTLILSSNGGKKLAVLNQIQHGDTNSYPLGLLLAKRDDLLIYHYD